MPRVKRGPKRKNRRGKILKAAKGFWGMKSRGHRIAKEQVARGLALAFYWRKDRNGYSRTLGWGGIKAAPRATLISSPPLLAALTAAGSTVDRKILADLAVRDSAAFAAFVETARGALDKLKAAAR